SGAALAAATNFLSPKDKTALRANILIGLAHFIFWFCLILPALCSCKLPGRKGPRPGGGTGAPARCCEKRDRREGTGQRSLGTWSRALGPWGRRFYSAARDNTSRRRH